MRQIKAGFKKEFMSFSRSFRLFGMALILLGTVLMSPATMKLSIELMKVMSDTMDQLTEGMTDEQLEQYNQMNEAQMLEQMFGAFSSFDEIDMSKMSVQMSFSDIGQTGMILVFVLLMAAAGTEQKKRSIMMPRSAGLTPMGYVLPKFVLYPLTVLVLSFLGCMLSNIAAQVCFGGMIDWSLLAFASLTMAVYIMFCAVLYMFIGISTGQPGLSVIYTLIITGLLSMLLPAVNIDKYNPFALTTISNNIVYSDKSAWIENIGAANYVLTLLITLAFCAVFFALTWFVVSAKKIDNTGDENY